jgi:hypothetical protein
MTATNVRSADHHTVMEAVGKDEPMSLDVYLTMDDVQNLEPGEKIFIREDGQNKEVTRAEWNERYPNRDPVVIDFPDGGKEVYTANITHNLNKMADEAGIYEALWRPEEIGISKAAQLIEPLKLGLALLDADPERFKKFSPANGWGTYAGLVLFVQDYLDACIFYPDANVSVSR